MTKFSVALIAAAMSALLAGCEGRGITPVTQNDIDDRGRILAANEAVAVGKYPLAEALMADYVYRNDKGELKLRFWGVSSKSRKLAIDVVSALLWETGKDDTAIQFADDYLSGTERKTVHCRIAERQARYDHAFECWNRMGQVDRAERVLRTKGAMEILAKP
jgi:hypothetical protein